MKSITYIFLIIVSLFVFSACSQTAGNESGEEPAIKEGWLSPDIYITSAIGAPKKDSEDLKQRRQEAKLNAENSARQKIIESFIGFRLECLDLRGASESETELVKEYTKLVNSKGSVVKTNFDKNDNCEVLFQVEKKGLKDEITSEQEAGD